MLPCTVVPGTIVPLAWQKSHADGSRKRTGVCGTDDELRKANIIAELGNGALTLLSFELKPLAMVRACSV